MEASEGSPSLADGTGVESVPKLEQPEEVRPHARIPLPPDPRQKGSPFANALWDLLGTVDTLSEILDEVLPLLASIDEQPEWQADVDRICKGMAQAERDEVNRFATDLVRVLPRVMDDSRAGKVVPGDSGSDSSGVIKVPDQDSEALPGPGGLSFEDPRLAELIGRLFAHTVATYRKPPKMSILAKASVTSLVDALELMIGQVVAAFYRLHPGALGSDQKEFSLDDLQSFGSISDAATAVIDRRVDAFLRSGLGDWESWFRRNLKLELSSLALDWDETVEMIQRRHILVHNGGRVSQLYLDNVSPRFHKTIGTELVLDESYIRRAIDLGTVLAVLLTMSIWARLVPHESSAAAQRCHERVYLLMKRGRWEAVKVTCELGRKGISARSADQIIFQMNEWLARKRIGGDEQLSKEISSFDDSALAPRFALARNALLDSHEAAKAAAEQGLSSGNVSIDELLDWPVLAELRSSPDFEVWLKEQQQRQAKREMEHQVGRYPGQVLIAAGDVEPVGLDGSHGSPDLDEGDAAGEATVTSPPSRPRQPNAENMASSISKP